MECDFSGGKELELVLEVQQYDLDIVGLTSTHCTGPGTKVLERSWSLCISGDSQGERWQAVVEILEIPLLSITVLDFSTESKRVASM